MANIPPPWASAASQPQQTEASPSPARRPDGTFAAGTSGNPAGPRKGSKQVRTQLAEALLDNGSALVQVAITKALKGDPSALALCLSRLVPVLKPKAERTPFALDTTKPSAEQAAQVLAAVAAGDLDHDAGKALIDAIAGIAQLKRFDQFEAELALLRQQMQRMGAASGNGGQVMFDMKDAAAACSRPLPKPTEAPQ